MQSIFCEFILLFLLNLFVWVRKGKFVQNGKLLCKINFKRCVNIHLFIYSFSFLVTTKFPIDNLGFSRDIFATIVCSMKWKLTHLSFANGKVCSCYIVDNTSSIFNEWWSWWWKSPFSCEFILNSDNWAFRRFLWSWVFLYSFSVFFCYFIGHTRKTLSKY